VPKPIINQYKIRTAQVGKDKRTTVYSIGLPPEVAQPLLNNDENRRFAAEFTDEGILFRPVPNAEATQVPDWA
jgi:CRISPR/Cas system endoribonuclease Cas6 (RAMP superfamily)